MCRGRIARRTGGLASRSVGNNVGAKSVGPQKRIRGYRLAICTPLMFLVGARGFEPPTTCTPCRYATRLRYAPIRERIIAEPLRTERLRRAGCRGDSEFPGATARS